MLVYVPPGTYLVSDTLDIWFYTHLVGNAKCPPTIKLASNVSNVPYVLSATSNPSGEHVSNFYHQIVNLNVDVGGNEGSYGIHWAVAQATAIRNVHIDATGSRGGLFCENGGGGTVADLTVVGGEVGFEMGGQQWTLERLHISDSTSACMRVIWNWAFAVLDSSFSRCPQGIDFSGQAVTSLAVVDTHFDSTPVAVATAYSGPGLGNASRGLLLDRVSASNVTVITPALPGPGAGSSFFVDLWRQDYAYHCSEALPQPWGASSLTPVRANTSLPSRSRPTLTQAGLAPVNAISDAGCKADGENDDSTCLQRALNLSVSNGQKTVFLPFGTYRVASTVTIPAGVTVVGELLSIIAVDGAAFASTASSVPAIAVQRGDPVTLMDLSITTLSDSTNVQLLQWDGGKGSAVFDMHFRLYHSCYGQWHFLPGSSAHVSNAWGWTADHDIDTGKLLTVKVPRGWLVEGDDVTLYGTACEHNYLYNYNFSGATNVITAMMQTESPYWAPSTSFGLTVEGGTSNMLSYASGFYSWFFGGQDTVSRVTEGTSNVSLFCHNVVGSAQLLTHGSGAISNTSSSAAGTFSSFLTADIDVVCSNE